jgi:hypothetical protein
MIWPQRVPAGERAWRAYAPTVTYCLERAKSATAKKVFALATVLQKIQAAPPHSREVAERSSRHETASLAHFDLEVAAAEATLAGLRCARVSALAAATDADAALDRFDQELTDKDARFLAAIAAADL